MSGTAENEDALYLQLIDSMDAELQVNPSNAGNITLAYYEQHKILRARLRETAEYRLTALVRQQDDEAAIEKEELSQRLVSFDRVDHEQQLKEWVDWYAKSGHRYAGWNLQRRVSAYDTLLGLIEEHPRQSSFRDLLKKWDAVNAQRIGILYPYSHRSLAERQDIRQILQNVAQDWRLLDAGEAFPVEFFIPNETKKVTTFFPDLDPRDLRNWPMGLLRSIEKLAQVSAGKCEEAIEHVRECWKERMEKEEEELWENPDWHEGMRLDEWMKVADVREALKRYGVHSSVGKEGDPIDVEIEETEQTEDMDGDAHAPPPQRKTRTSARDKTSSRSSKPHFGSNFKPPSNLMPRSVDPELLRKLGLRKRGEHEEEVEEEEEAYEPPPAEHEFVTSLAYEPSGSRRSRQIMESTLNPACGSRSRDNPVDAGAGEEDEDEAEYEPPSASARFVSSTRGTRSHESSRKIVSVTSAGTGKTRVVSSKEKPGRKGAERTKPDAKKPASSKKSNSTKAGNQNSTFPRKTDDKRMHLRSLRPGRKTTVVESVAEPVAATKKVASKMASSSRKTPHPKKTSRSKVSSPENPDSTNAGVKKAVAAKKVSSIRTSSSSTGSRRQIALARVMEHGFLMPVNETAGSRVSSRVSSRRRAQRSVDAPQPRTPTALMAQPQVAVFDSVAPQAAAVAAPAPQIPTGQTPASQRLRKRKRPDWGERTYQPSTSVRKKVKRNNEPQLADEGRQIGHSKVKQAHQSSSASARAGKSSSKGGISEGELATTQPFAQVRKVSLRDAFAEVGDAESGYDEDDEDFVPSDGSSETSNGGHTMVSENDLAVMAPSAGVIEEGLDGNAAVVVEELGSVAAVVAEEEPEVVAQDIIEHEGVSQVRDQEPHPEFEAAGEPRRQSDGETSAFFRNSLGQSRRVGKGHDGNEGESWKGSDRFPGVQSKRGV